MNQDRVIAALKAVGVEADNLSPTDSLADFGMDSLAMVLLVPVLEKEFQIKIPLAKLNSNDFFSLSTLSDLIARYT